MDAIYKIKLRYICTVTVSVLDAVSVLETMTFHLYCLTLDEIINTLICSRSIFIKIRNIHGNYLILGTGYRNARQTA